MLSILLSVCIGLGIGYFATQNTAPVSLHLGEFVLDNVPLYMVAVGSLLIGVISAWIFYFARLLSGSIAVSGRERNLSRVERSVAELEHRTRELEAANAQLRGERSSETRTSAAA